MVRSARLLFSAALFALASQGAQAAEGKAQGEAKFESLDKNSDGKVSLNEASEHDGLFVAFENLDKNKDGTLTKEEFASYRASR
jgi:Ca2+-binding EF-hand superfamily protein